MTRPLRFIDVKTIKYPAFSSTQLRVLLDDINFDLRDAPDPSQPMEVRGDRYRVTTKELNTVADLYKAAGMIVSEVRYDAVQGPSFLLSAPFFSPERNRELVLEHARDTRAWRKKLKAAEAEGTLETLYGKKSAAQKT